MTDRMIEVAEGFWNVRGSMKLAGLVDVGTQMSLVRLANGDFVLLDSYRLVPELERRVHALTDGGRALRAVLNLHPFHTLHVRATAAQFPHARLYGTRRHKQQAPELAWEPLCTEDEALHAQFADDFSFSVPRGVDFVPHNPQLHFSSVLALHRRSRTLHVDDTLMWLDLPVLSRLQLHPSLRFVLQKRPGAVDAFRRWAQELLVLSQSAAHLCTAHGRALPPPSVQGHGIRESVGAALARVQGVLDAHDRRYGGTA